jgi:hypothetical protein
MESDCGFESFSEAIKSDPIGELFAKWRRDAFIAKLERLPDVAEVISSGSVARDTYIGIPRDVDLIVVYKSSAHHDYGDGAESAKQAMQHLERQLLQQLNPLSGGEPGLLRDTEPRDHVVRCLGGWTGPFADIIPSAPPVDVMPAIRRGSHLRIPEQGNRWKSVDPEKLIRDVEQRQREWSYFTEVIRMVKAWAERNHLNLKSFAVETMVLKYCPRPGLFQTLSCGEALARFFDNAAKAHVVSLNVRLGIALSNAAELAGKAMDAEYLWENRRLATRQVTHPDEFWRELFGSSYPRARERFWRPPSSEPWFGKAAAGPSETGSKREAQARGWRDGGEPKPPKGGGWTPPDGGGPRPGGGGWTPPDGGGPRPGGGGWTPPDGGGPRPGGGGWTPPDSGGPRPGDAGPTFREVPEQGADWWTNVFESAGVVAVSIPLTFG